MRPHVLTLLLVSSFVVSGCVAGIATSAVGMAVRSARGEPQDNQQSQGVATQACSAQAAQYGAVHIIDVQQSTMSKIVVWGTVGEGDRRQSFECSYGTKITGFKLRAITSR